MILIFLVLQLIILNLYSQKKYLNLAKKGYEQYQDIIINGKIIQKANNNHNDGEVRFNLIDSILQKFKRPFTMLDLGASQGYYSILAATKYDKSVFVMIEGNNNYYPFIGTQLLDICKCNTSLKNIILLKKHLIISDIKRLSECEYFDIVLALNIIHWFKYSWKNLINHILELGSQVIIETPPQEVLNQLNDNKLKKEIEDYIKLKKGKLIGQVKRHTSETYSKVFLISNIEKKIIKRENWKAEYNENSKDYLISNQHEKLLFKEKNLKPIYCKPGINLYTYKFYNGSHPSLHSESFRKLFLEKG